MEIKSTLINKAAEELTVIYRDIDSSSGLEGRKVSGVRAYCFLGNKLVIVCAGAKGAWTPPGGGVEDGESYEQAVVREVLEETNMKVIKQAVLGYQDITEKDRIITQTRSVCIVEPYGEFVSDPDEDITEMRLIDPAEYKEYFDWGVVGDHLMKRALELKSTL